MTDLPTYLASVEFQARIGVEEIIINDSITLSEKIILLQEIYELHNRTMDYIDRRIEDLKVMKQNPTITDKVTS